MASEGGADELARLAQAFRSGDYREVTAGAIRLRATMATEPAVHLLLGDAWSRLGHYGWAAGAYQDALDLSPDARTYGRGARVRWLYGDIDGAIELLEDALQSTADRDTAARLFAELGELMLDSGATRAAERARKRALELAPHPAALALDARMAEAAGNWKRAEKSWMQLIARAPSAEAYLGAYRVRTEIGDRNGALAMFDRALARRDSEPLPIAMQLVSEGRRPQLALALAQDAHRREPTIAADHAMAMALAENQRFTEALVYAMRATRLGTPHAELWLARASIESRLGLARRAATSLARAGKLESRYLAMQEGN